MLEEQYILAMLFTCGNQGAAGGGTRKEADRAAALAARRARARAALAPEPDQAPGARRA